MNQQKTGLFPTVQTSRDRGSNLFKRLTPLWLAGIALLVLRQAAQKRMRLDIAQQVSGWRRLSASSPVISRIGGQG